MFTSKVCSGRLYINNIVSGETVESLPELPDGTKEITCDECHHSFTFAPTYTTGDPRNIALIGKSYSVLSNIANDVIDMM